MKTQTRKTGINPANQNELTPEEFQNHLAHAEEFDKWWESFKVRLDHLKRLGAVTNVDELRKLYS